MQDYSDRLAVIGAGPVGLAVAKALLANHIAYDQLEADDEVGGNWYHGVYRTAHIISSKKTTEYADYPMPPDYPDFPSAQQMCAYLQDYADHFGLRRHIQFKTKLVMARPVAGDQWELELANGERRVYQGLIVCNGHHWQRRWPEYEGEFAGEFYHSKDYRQPEQLAGKRILVIGGGNSACDVAAEAARVGESAHISLRRGYWFLPKAAFGAPIADTPLGWSPVWFQRLLLRFVVRVIVGKYSDYGLPTPDHRVFDRHPTLNSELLHYVKHGRIKPRPDIARFAGNTVHFVDGSADEYDAVVCGTGFYVSFPFLPEGLVPVKNGNLAQVYAGCVLPDYKNLYLPGTVQARYGFGPLVTPMADLLAELVKLQSRMELPIGLVIKESGGKLPTSHLVNPYAALRQMKRAKWFLPMLLGKEKKLRTRLLKPQPKADLPATAQTDLQVY